MLYLCDDYTLNTPLYELRHASVSCPLEPQVFAVLRYLIEHRDRVVTRQEILLSPPLYIAPLAGRVRRGLQMRPASHRPVGLLGHALSTMTAHPCHLLSQGRVRRAAPLFPHNRLTQQL